MPNVLTIDQGNTTSKTTVFGFGGEVLYTHRSEVLTIEHLAETVESWDVESAIYCSVARIDVRLVESLRLLLDDRLLALTPSTPLPIGIDYLTPKTLGADRIAACAGAWAAHPGEAMLVVDAGSALTVDTIDSTGCFRGGNISAGIDLRLRALHEYCDRLPEVSHEGTTPPFGRDTDTALRSGAVLGVADEIAGTYARARAMYGCRRIVLTGGNGALLHDALLQHNDIDTTVDGLLVARGLYSIYQYNEKII